ncbi:MAG: lipid-A-disaccharide synthase [Opitutia bacterium]|nr:MAG: lipid-A-disaccharide synthase [Opitutae bacterium]
MTMSALSLPFRLPAPEGGPVDVLIIAGEHSGDEHAAQLVRDVRAAQPTLRFAALGGPELSGAGPQLLFDLTASSVVGLVEVLKNYSFFKALMEETLRWIGEHRPRAVLFVDYPGMNLRLAAALRERGLSVKGGGTIKTLFYISPQIWAWKDKRRFTMARDLDALAVIFPFEVACYADTTLPVNFVGHPFLAVDYVPPVRYDPSGPILLLPGSRKQAVGRIFPVLLAGYAEFLRGGGDRDAVAVYPSEEILAELHAAGPSKPVKLVPTGTLVSASVVLTSSGTMSMHCALAGIPGAIAYRANFLTYLLGRMLVKIEFLGIANLLLKAPMYPEFIQDAATPPALAEQLRSGLEDPARRVRTTAQAAELRALLERPTGGTAGAWLRRQLAGG